MLIYRHVKSKYAIFFTFLRRYLILNRLDSVNKIYDSFTKKHRGFIYEQDKDQQRLAILQGRTG